MLTKRDTEKNIAKEMAYDSLNRIKRVTNPDTGSLRGEYWYDDQGFRVRKRALQEIDGETRRVDLEYPSQYFCVERQTTPGGAPIPESGYAVSNIYMNGVRVAAVIPNGSARYYLTDEVDSVKAVVDDTGKIVSRMEFLPYGETWVQEGEKKYAAKFNSQELDQESNFYFYNARHYDPEVGRFVTADTVIDGGGSTQGWNRYMYVKGNPVRYSDPTGNTAAGAALGGLLGFITPVPGGTGLGAWLGDKISDALSSKSASAEGGQENSSTNNNVQAQALHQANETQNHTNNIRNSRISQTAPSINQDDNAMSQAGCYFRAIQSVAEEYAGRNLTANQINKAKTFLQSGDNPAVRSDMNVRNPDRVLNHAFRRLEMSNLTGTVDWGAEPGQNPNYSIMRGPTTFPSGAHGIHYRQGDSEGNQTWDPALGGNTTTDRTYNVFIHRNDN